MSDTPATQVGVLVVRAFIERDNRPFLIDDAPIGGSADTDTYIAETADPQGPLGELYAFGASVEDAARGLAEQVWSVVRGSMTADEQAETPVDPVRELSGGLCPDEVRTIRICTGSVTRHPVTSVARTDLVLVVPYTVAFAASAVYAVVDETVPALNGLAGSATTDRGAIADLLCRLRVKILSGGLAPHIPGDWPGTLLLHRMRAFTYPVTQLARHTAA